MDVIEASHLSYDETRKFDGKRIETSVSAHLGVYGKDASHHQHTILQPALHRLTQRQR